MASISQHVSDIRDLIKQVQDDSNYTDAFLYSLLNKAKTRLQWQRARRYNFLSDFNWATFCVKLVKEKSHDCDCVPVGCDVLKSKYQLPRPISTPLMDLFKVRTLDGTLIPRKTEEQVKVDMLDDVKSNEVSYSIKDRRIIIWNNLTYPVIEVSSIPEDISEWANINYCDTEGNEENKPCYDITKDDFGLESDLVIIAYQMVLEMLNIPLRLMEDSTNDQNTEIKM